MLIFWIDIFGTRHHKFNLEEFNIKFSGETLVRPYGDQIVCGSLLLSPDNYT